MNEGQAIMIRGRYDLPLDMLKFLCTELSVDLNTYDLKRMENMISRNLYRGGGGMWLRFIKPQDMGAGKQTQIWCIDIEGDPKYPKRKAIANRIWLHGQRPQFLENIPRAVRYFFALIPRGSDDDPNPRTNVMHVSWATNRKLKARGAVLEVDHSDPRHTIVKSKIRVPIVKFVKGGVQMGSIVEGTDQATDTYELYWPFTAKEFWHTVEKVGEESNWIWDNTHGCEECADLWGTDWISGQIKVHPNCTECEGVGVSI